MRQRTLRPGDVVVALQVALSPDSPLLVLAERSGRSLGEVHNAVGRLRSAGLMSAEFRRAEREPLLQFIRWGVPYAFPPAVGGETIGITTATLVNVPTGPSGSADSPERTEFVWASADGTSRGTALEPLHPRVTEIVAHNAPLYALLAAVDLIRIGGARERLAAAGQIERLIMDKAPHG